MSDKNSELRQRLRGMLQEIADEAGTTPETCLDILLGLDLPPVSMTVGSLLAMQFDASPNHVVSSPPLN